MADNIDNLISKIKNIGVSAPLFSEVRESVKSFSDLEKLSRLNYAELNRVGLVGLNPKKHLHLFPFLNPERVNQRVSDLRSRLEKSSADIDSKTLSEFENALLQASTMGQDPSVAWSDVSGFLDELDVKVKQAISGEGIFGQRKKREELLKAMEDRPLSLGTEFRGMGLLQPAPLLLGNGV